MPVDRPPQGRGGPNYSVAPYRVAQPFALSEQELVSGVSVALTRTDTCAHDVQVAVYASLDGTALATATTGRPPPHPISAAPSP